MLKFKLKSNDFIFPFGIKKKVSFFLSFNQSSQTINFYFAPCHYVEEKL